MKKFLLALLLVNATAPSFAADDGFDPESCRGVRGAVELFLGLADAKFREAEQQRSEGNEASADASFGEAIMFSDLAANYATVFDAFCGD